MYFIKIHHDKLYHGERERGREKNKNLHRPVGSAETVTTLDPWLTPLVDTTGSIGLVVVGGKKRGRCDSSGYTQTA